MGVLTCDRRGCDNIMSEYFSHELQLYCCGECYDEMILKAPKNVKMFMETKKKNKKEKRRKKIELLFKRL